MNESNHTFASRDGEKQDRAAIGNGSNSATALSSRPPPGAPWRAAVCIICAGIPFVVMFVAAFTFGYKWQLVLAAAGIALAQVTIRSMVRTGVRIGGIIIAAYAIIVAVVAMLYYVFLVAIERLPWLG
jgi:hypothetical protein